MENKLKLYLVLFLFTKPDLSFYRENIFMNMNKLLFIIDEDWYDSYFSQNALQIFHFKENWTDKGKFQVFEYLVHVWSNKIINLLIRDSKSVIHYNTLNKHVERNNI